MSGAWRGSRASLLVFALLLACGTRSVFSVDTFSRGALRWGADAEGGAPYVYPDPQKRETLKKLLEDAGADATAKDEDGLTARDWESQSADSN